MYYSKRMSMLEMQGHVYWLIHNVYPLSMQLQKVVTRQKNKSPIGGQTKLVFSGKQSVSFGIAAQTNHWEDHNEGYKCPTYYESIHINVYVRVLC